MAFPLSPVNGQRTVLNNITYTYNSTYGVWTRVVDTTTTGAFANGAFAAANSSFAKSNTAVALAIVFGI
jgi:hypothetical protein